MSPPEKFTRRQIITASVAAATVTHRVAFASGRLSPTDAQAANLGYVENSKQVDVKRFPTYKAGQTCANCKFIQARYGFYRPCQLFPNNSVSEKGWCSAWIKNSS